MTKENAVREALREVIDPELGIDVVELGMVGPISFDGNNVLVNMRLTSMSCPFWELFIEQVKSAVGEVDDVTEVEVEFDDTEPWTPSLMTDSARVQLEAVGLMPPTLRQDPSCAGRGELLQVANAVLGSPLKTGRS